MNACSLAIVAAAAVTLGSVSASSPAAAPHGYRVLVQSDRDGGMRLYSVRPDGSDLRPVLARSDGLHAVAVSRDGRTVAYRAAGRTHLSLYVSRADGRNLHRVVADAGHWGSPPAFSPDGRLLGFTKEGVLFIVATDGSGLRRLADGATPADAPTWSTDGRTLAFTRFTRGGKIAELVVRPLDSRPRVVARRRSAIFSQPSWSPDGRWIAFRNDSGRPGPHRDAIELVRPSGTGRHAVYRDAYVPEGRIAWSPDGKELAFGIGAERVLDLGIARPAGGTRRLALGFAAPFFSGPLWSPDGRRLLIGDHTAYDPNELWSIGAYGRRLVRLTDAGNTSLLGWTQLAPALPPAPPVAPAEKIVRADSLVTGRPITALAADGPRVAFITSGRRDCEHVAVWAPAERSLERLSPSLPAPCPISDLGNAGGGLYGVGLAGSRAGWTAVLGCGNYCEVELRTAALGERVPPFLGVEDSYLSADEPGEDGGDFRLRGAGDLMVFNKQSSLVRLGGGTEKCSGYPTAARICATLRSGDHAAVVDSVAGALIAVRERDAVAVVDERGRLVHVFPFLPDDVSAARLDGSSLVVARLAYLEVYDIVSGERLSSQPLPSGYMLADADGGIVMLQRKSTLQLLRLADGRSLSLTPGSSPLLADLEPPGLYYSFSSGKTGRLVFLPRAELSKQLDQSIR